MSGESGGLRLKWRNYVEDHALESSTAVRLAARLAPAAPRVAERVAGAPAVPRGDHRVSVVVPSFNYGHFLPDAVESAVTQTGVDVEVIIVDDCSTDDSLRVAEGLAEKDSRVRVLANEANSGHVRSFNRGWDASSGEFVVKLDADDLLAPGALARAAALFVERPNVGLVYGHPRHFWSAEPPAARVGEPFWTIWRGLDWLAERCARGGTAITNPEMVLRSSLLRESGPMNPDIPYGPDMEISLRLATISDVGFIGGSDQALHREHSNSMSVTEADDAIVDLGARLAAFEAALGSEHEANLSAAEREHLLISARRAVAGHALRYAAAARDRGEPATGSSELLDFARELLPVAERSRAEPWTQPEHPVAVVAHRGGRLARRVQRALHSEGLHARWMMSGV
ncbi:MAG: glycosyltransferase family A protein [Gordonia sp. (in: high G+C Gram-positive bacteria)]